MSPTVVVVGLGPGDDDLVTAGTLAAIGGAPAVFGRTSRHPAASVLGDATFFDDVYESADTMDEVYSTIVDRLVDAASRQSGIVYAVPGSPLVAERTVQLLLADDRVRTEVVPALSFLDLAWVRLGIDPIEAGVRVVDGHRFAVDAAGQRGPLLVCQCDSSLVLSDVKLLIEDWPDEPVTVIQRLGLPDEEIFAVEWAELDRSVRADHLTSIYIPVLDQPVAAELVRFDELVHALRTGCPWDRTQTHESLKRYLLEECYELLEAIDGFDPETGDGADDLAEELGDVLFQVFFHSTIAAESGWFTLADVARSVHDKLRDRHPHVFGSATFETADDLAASWEASKQAEKSRGSVMEGIPAELPALLYALKVHKKAATSEYEEPVPDSVATLVDSVVAADLDAATLGELLFGIADVARRAGVDPEDELRRASRRFVDRFDAR